MMDLDPKLQLHRLCNSLRTVDCKAHLARDQRLSGFSYSNEPNVQPGFCICRYVWKLFIVTVACKRYRDDECLCKFQTRIHTRNNCTEDSYHIAICCPRHDIPFDGYDEFQRLTCGKEDHEEEAEAEVEPHLL